MIHVDTGSFFVIVLVAAIAATTVAIVPGRFAPPVVVVELVLGIAGRPPGPRHRRHLRLHRVLLQPRPGDALLLRRLRDRLRADQGHSRWSSARAAGRFRLRSPTGSAACSPLPAIVVSFLYTGSAMATTAIGTLIPILRDSGGLKTRFGTYLLAAGGAGEFGPILLVTLVLSTDEPLHEAAILIAFVLLALGVALASVRPRLARLAGLRENLRGEQPARRADHRRPRLRPGAAGQPARPRRPARRLRCRDDHERRSGATSCRSSSRS